MRIRIVPAAALVAAAIVLSPLGSTLARAAHEKAPWWVPQLRAGELAPAAAQSATQEVPTNPAPPPPKPETPAPAPAPAAAAGTTAATAAAAPAPLILPDATLMKYNSQLREGVVGRDANARAYIDLIGAGRATPAQVNDFAAYVAKRGMPKLAVAYQEYAIRLDGNDAVLWLNLGTMRQTLGKYGSAEEAYKKSLALDPNDGLTHYNLGAAYDAQKKYDEAIDEYRIALVLDPGLGDPKKNPQVVNNEHLLAVKLEIYRNQAGSLGLPLKQMQTPAKPAKPAAETNPADPH